MRVIREVSVADILHQTAVCMETSEARTIHANLRVISLPEGLLRELGLRSTGEQTFR
jgi:hypothetical protein